MLCFCLSVIWVSCEKSTEQTTISKATPSPEDDDCVYEFKLIDTNFSKSLRVFGKYKGTAPSKVYLVPDPCETVSLGY